MIPAKLEERPGPPIRNKKMPNTMIFPQHLRDAIPVYGGRVLVFDSVTGKTNSHFSIVPTVPRAQVKLVVHETGKLSGAFDIWLDLDSDTMRALGQFFVDLADKAEAEKPSAN